MTDFAIESNLDPVRLGEQFVRTGRLQLSGFLSDDSARALYAELADSPAWRLTANKGEEVIDFQPEALARFGPEEWTKLRRATALGGRYGFQFMYETIRLPKIAGEPSPVPLLSRFAEFMSSPGTVEFLRTMTGAADITFADAHASRYHPGHFLTTHDDRVDAMNRRAAYVLNLSPEWRPDWGGLLVFHDVQGNIVRGYTPGFNVLNIFLVPQAHAVTWVTPLAAAPRYAVTGWLRAGERGSPPIQTPPAPALSMPPPRR